MRFTKDKPNPQPRFLVVYPGLKTVLNFDFGIPFPVSAKSISTTFSLSSTFSEISPCPSMASTAFFVRFSITQANRESFIKTNIGRSGKYVLIFTFEEIRVSMYPKAARMDSTIFVGTGSGSEPILEKRSAIVCKRFTSLSISVNREGSISFVRKYSTQAISEDIGVPNW